MIHALYPGTFDPITNGHLDLIERSNSLFEKLTVAVAENINKNSLFSIKERMSLINNLTSEINPDINVVSFNCLLVELITENHYNVVIRGLRAISDFEYEMQMALMNRKLNPEYEVIFLMPNEKNLYLSSSLVKEIAKLNGDISELVPDNVQRAIKNKFLSKD